ncbi:hypothetical protein Dda_2431 [Drechslerella dactyloides]|uniref:Uncharacterized protein n=1 Tax=Drechslerella dactyloides TaxID=74499 RepID=A0AAD6NMB7_DREDA|nr:hypothetical protein Dda_2431 [Drechslerella dactyloides]
MAEPLLVSVIVSVAATVSVAVASPVAYGGGPGAAATTATVPVAVATTAAYHRVHLHHPVGDVDSGDYGYTKGPMNGNTNGGNNGNNGGNGGNGNNGNNGNNGSNVSNGSNGSNSGTNSGNNGNNGNNGSNGSNSGGVGGNNSGNVVGGNTSGNTIGGNTGGNVIGGNTGGNVVGGSTGGNVIGGSNGGTGGGLGGLGGSGNPLGGLMGGGSGLGGGLLSPLSLILGAAGSHNGFMLFRKAFDLLSEKACDFALNEAARFADFWVLVPAQSLQEIFTAWDEVATAGNGGFQGVSAADVAAVQQRVDLTKQVTGFFRPGTFEGVQPGEFKTTTSYLRCRQLSDTNPDAFVQMSPENPANPLGGLTSGGLTSGLPLGGLPLGF